MHIQWPESIYKWCKLIPMNDSGFNSFKNRLKWYKDNGAVILFTVHNLLPHDNVTNFDIDIYNLIFEYSDIIAHHGKSSIDIIKSKYPQSKKALHIISPHGPYKKKKLLEKEEAKKFYNLPSDKLVFTNFGKQRSYKGMNFNYEVFKKWNKEDTCFFNIGLLMGECKPIEHDKDSNFEYKQIYKNVPDTEVSTIISATDIFFLGHSSGLNSGIISLALTYSKPIIFPDIGNFKNQVEGWELFETYEVNNIDSAIKAIETLYKKIQENPKIDNKNWLNINSWDTHVKNILTTLNNIK